MNKTKKQQITKTEMVTTDGVERKTYYIVNFISGTRINNKTNNQEKKCNHRER